MVVIGLTVEASGDTFVMFVPDAVVLVPSVSSNDNQIIDGVDLATPPVLALPVVRRLDLLLAKSPLFLCAVVRRIGTVLKIKKSIVVSTAARNPSIVHWKSTFNAHYINIA